MTTIRDVQDHPGAFKTTQDPLASLRTNQNHLGQFKAIQNHPESSKIINDKSKLFRVNIQQHLRRIRTIQDLFGLWLFTTNHSHSGPFTAIQDHQEPSRIPTHSRSFAAIQNYTELFRTIHSHSAPSGSLSIIHQHSQQFRTIQHNSSTFGTVHGHSEPQAIMDHCIEDHSDPCRNYLWQFRAIGIIQYRSGLLRTIR